MQLSDITPQYVDDKLKSISTNKDLSAFILLRKNIQKEKNS